LRVVEGILHLPAKLQSLALAHGERLEQSEVEIVGAGRQERVPTVQYWAARSLRPSKRRKARRTRWHPGRGSR
jgi:hypothetical protein